ncbi:sulfotransferase family protein [Alteromonas gilva]|uniref:Sulfotransferase n=1 Tax=Alteromonas gilva TaxID=2987522 RepID=A0ABT5L0D1_9ALTE|nr:sulfotransferase [Alteromonas gilva]MDC8830338.1 sulfotransferase [Alteromonas gilva]
MSKLDLPKKKLKHCRDGESYCDSIASLERVYQAMKNIDFLGIGVQRAGTTWLHNCLSEHPELCLPQQKELQFFNAFYNKGYDWYFDQFKPKDLEWKLGEITPNYFYSKAALDRISKDYPNIKVILILREPCSRTYSAYELFKGKRCADTDLVSACQQSEFLIRESLYSEMYKYLVQKLSTENILVKLYDDIERTPDTFISDVYKHLGVDSSFKPSSLTTRYNKVIYPKLQQALQKAKLNFLIEIVKDSRLGNTIRKSQSQPSERNRFTKNELMAHYGKIFRDDVKSLKSLTDLDFSGWDLDS